VIIVDGGSNDGTEKIAKKLGVDMIVGNPLTIEEAGKPLAIDVASKELIAFIDSDNVMPSTDWIKKMVKPFEDSEITGSGPLCYEYERTYGLITRYCSLIGSDDAIYPYLGNYDRFCYFKGKWTEVQLLMIEDKGDYLKFRLDRTKIPTMGANGFFVRREVLQKIRYKPLHLHVDTVYRLVASGYNCMAKVKVGITHLHSETISTYIKKKIRRIQKRYYFRRYMEVFPLDRRRVASLILGLILIFPIFRDVIRGYKRIPDRAWLFHYPACILSTLTYAFGSLIYSWTHMEKR